MNDRKDKPKLTLELMQTVNRMGHVRREMKELETEESLLRDQILAAIKGWPREIFPIRIGDFEVRVSERRGRVDLIHAEEILLKQQLVDELSEEAHIKSERSLASLAREIQERPMPDETRDALGKRYENAIEWHPCISHDVLNAFYQSSRLSWSEYEACFKDGKPVILALTVR